MNLIRYFTLIAICGINIFSQTFNPSNIEFTLSLEKDTFFVDEPLFLELREKNITQQNVYISNGPVGQIFVLELISGNGERLKWFSGIMGDYMHNKAISYTILQPGESQYYSKDLLEGFGNFIKYKGKRAKNLPEGTYRLTVTHKAMESWKKDFYKDDSPEIFPIISNTLIFTIINPKSENEAERQTYCNALKHFYREDDSQGINNYLENYIDSPNYYKYDILQCAIRYKINKAYIGKYNFNLSLEEMVDKVANSNASFYITNPLRRFFEDSNKNQEIIDTEQYNRIKEKLTNSKSDSKLSIYYRMEIKKMKNYKIKLGE